MRTEVEIRERIAALDHVREGIAELAKAPATSARHQFMVRQIEELGVAIWSLQWALGEHDGSAENTTSENRPVRG